MVLGRRDCTSEKRRVKVHLVELRTSIDKVVQPRGCAADLEVTTLSCEHGRIVGCRKHGQAIRGHRTGHDDKAVLLQFVHALYCPRIGVPASCWLAAIRAFQSAGPVLCTLVPSAETATVTGISTTSKW